MTNLSKPEKPGLFSYVNLVHAVAGGCGSAFAMSTLYPLDIVRTRFQLEDGFRNKNTFAAIMEIYQKEGLNGLYRGLLPVIQSLYCSNFVYFYTFHAMSNISNKEKSALKSLIFGMIAGSINVLTTTPLWVVNTRIKMQGMKSNDDQATIKYKGLMHGLRRIKKEEGILGLWSGTLSSLLLVINPAIQFMIYETIKKRSEKFRGKAGMSAIMAFLTGAVAKAFATTVTYPLQLIQTKQRHGQITPGHPNNAGILHMFLYITKLYGVKGLFKGLEAKILQTVLTAALMFTFYEKIAHTVFTLLMKKNKMSQR